MQHTQVPTSPPTPPPTSPLHKPLLNPVPEIARYNLEQHLLWIRDILTSLYMSCLAKDIINELWEELLEYDTKIAFVIDRIYQGKFYKLDYEVLEELAKFVEDRMDELLAVDEVGLDLEKVLDVLETLPFAYKNCHYSSC